MIALDKKTIIFLAIFVGQSMYGAGAVPAAAGQTAKALEVKNFDLSALGNSVDLSNIFKVNSNGATAGFGVENDIFSLLFDIDCPLPDNTKLLSTVPDIGDICQKDGGKYGLSKLFDISVGPCNAQLTGGVGGIKANLGTWCEDRGKKHTPIDVVSGSGEVRTVITSNGESAEVTYPSGVTTQQVNSATSVGGLLDSNNSFAVQVAYDDDPYWTEMIRAWVREGNKVEDFSPATSVFVPDDMEQYMTEVGKTSELLKPDIKFQRLQGAITADLKGAYLGSAQDADAGAKALSDCKTMKEAKEREKKLYDYMLTGGVGIKVASAKSDDKLASTNLYSVITKLDTNRVGNPTKEQKDRLKPEQQAIFIKKAHLQYMKDSVSMWQLKRIQELEERRRDLMLEVAATAASPYYGEVAFREIEAMLKKIH